MQRRDGFDIEPASQSVMHATLGEIEPHEGLDHADVVVTSVGSKPGKDVAVSFLKLLRSSEDWDRRVEKERVAREKEGGENFQPKSIQEIRRAANAAKLKAEEREEKGTAIVSTSLVATCPEAYCGVNVLLRYTGPNGPGVLFNALEVRPSAYNANRCPFLVNAQYDTDVSFQEGGVEKDVVVVVKNRVFNATPLTFAFEVGAPSGVEISGPTSFQSVLAGGEEQRVILKALYLRKGIFNLQKIRCVVGNVPFLFAFQWIVKVR